MTESVDPVVLKTFGLLLGTHYEIIEKCLVNLKPAELCRVARVCKSWSKVAKSLVAKQSRPMAVICDVETNPMKEVVTTDAIKHCYEDCIGYQSTVCFSFVAEKCFQQLDLPGLRKFMSPSCRNFCVPADGIVGTKLDGTADALLSFQFIPNNARCKFKARLSSFLLPPVPGVEIYTFHGTTDPSAEYRFQNEKLDSGSIAEIIPQSEKVKCAVVVAFESPERAAEFYSDLAKRQEEPFAFGGYFASDENSMYADYGVAQSYRTLSACGIVITGDNVEAASVVVKTQSNKDIKESLEKLKASNFPDKNTICLMFSCVGRTKTAKEIKVYQSLFPNVPLTGCTGFGEFGMDCFAGNDRDQPSLNKKIKEEKSMLHSFASVYVMIHWKI
ncbi:F-box only protein 22-like [Neocloeon triangulifer]|uniref:F-box only protein 22-like n=1 Tax=Neocloeon triangulifer TaxID=2078957 RepID=UPI00286F3971|nr:F-box only protein 22-like [Neocloeon triangulifer]